MMLNFANDQQLRELLLKSNVVAASTPVAVAHEHKERLFRIFASLNYQDYEQDCEVARDLLKTRSNESSWIRPRMTTQRKQSFKHKLAAGKDVLGPVIKVRN